MTLVHSLSYVAVEEVDLFLIHTDEHSQMLICFGVMNLVFGVHETYC